MKYVLALLLVCTPTFAGIVEVLHEVQIIYNGQCVTKWGEQSCFIYTLGDELIVVFTQRTFRGVKPLRIYTCSTDGCKLIWSHPDTLT